MRGGSLLPREKADEIMARLSDIAERSGEETVLARRIAAYVAELAKSFDGRPLVGVRFDSRFPGPGARLAHVDTGTGAEKAGLQPGDVVLEFGGTALASFNDFMKALAGRRPGETVEVEVRRATGETETLELTLGRRLPRR
jgi:S1-C subfamily serine protease